MARSGLPMVVSVSGWQCAGKTTLARRLGVVLDAVVLSRDPLMQVLAAGGLSHVGDGKVQSIPVLGYALQAALLEDQLSMDRSVVLECVALPNVRRRWQEIAHSAGARFWAVECICSDEELHRSRFEQREERAIGDWKLTWHHIEETRRLYEMYQPHVLADAIDSIEDNVAKVVRVVEQTSIS